MLLLKRLTAFFLDVCILGIPLALLAMFVFIDLLEWGFQGNVFILASVISYFGVLGGAFRGQTLGKRLAGIRIAMVGGGAPSYYQCFYRSMILLFSTDLIILVVALLSTVFRWSVDSFRTTTFAASLAVPIIIVLSLIASRGRIGIHDLVSQTEVVPLGSLPPMPRSPRWLVVAALVPGVLLAGTITIWLSRSLYSTMTDVLTEKAVTEEVIEGHKRAFRDLQMLPLFFKDGPEYMPGRVVFSSRAWADSDRTSINLKGSPAPLSDATRNTELDLDEVAVYRVPVHRRGYLSGTFQSVVCNRLASRGLGPRRAVEVQFTISRKMFCFASIRERTWHVLPVKESGGNLHWVSIEADVGEGWSFEFCSSSVGALAADARWPN